MLFRLAIVVSSDPINFINAYSLPLKHTRNMYIVHSQSWIDYCSQLWQAEMTFFHL